MPVQVSLPRTLRRYGGDHSLLDVDAAPLGQLLTDLCRQYPALKDRLLTADGNLMGHLAVCMQGQLVSPAAVPETNVQDGDLVEILFVASGG